MSLIRSRALAFRAVVTLAVCGVAVAGCGSGGSPSAKAAGGGTIALGAPASLSGPGAVIGEGATRGMEMAVANLDASGGVLKHRVELVSKDDQGEVSTALSLTREMTASQHVAAILGSSTSATAAAEAGVANQTKTPLLLWGGNDTSLTQGANLPYVFQLEPSTYMEPRASAQYLSRIHATRYYFIAPDYSFGHNTVAEFKQAMKEIGHPIVDVGEQYVPVGTSSYGSYISAALAAKAQVIYTLMFGSDETTLLKQAKSYGAFAKAHVFAILGTDVESVMHSETPTGLLLEDRAPFFGIAGSAASAFASEYKAKYGEWPTEWALLGYSAVQMWADAAKKAGSLEGAKVASALSGHEYATVRGPIEVRSCDHQALVSDYFWQVGNGTDSYGLPQTVGMFVSEPSKTLPSCP